MNAKTYGQFIAICMFTNSVGVALGLAISSFAPSIEVANAIGPVFIIVGILFGGFYIQVSSLPVVLDWFPYMSLFRWSFQALTINEFAGETFSCSSSNTNNCLLTGEDVLQTLSYSGHTVRYPLFGLGMILIAFLAGLYIFLLLNQIRYTPLGHVGSTFKIKATTEQQQVTNISPKIVSAVENQGSPSYQLVPSVDEKDKEGKKEVELV
jgi:hypothetical protein